MIDLACVDDIDPGGAEVSGYVAIEQSAARRLTSAKGSILMAPDDGIDLRDYLGESVDAVVLASLRGEIVDELEKEDAILSATVDLFDFTAEALTVSLSIVTGEGPYAFDLAIDAVTVRIIHREGT